MSAPLNGVLCPIPTPFGSDGSASPGRLGDQVAVYEAFELAGVLLFGTSGEGPLLDEDEEAGLLEAARRATSRKVVAQVGRESVRAAVRAAVRAEDAGADALLCLPPWYYPVDRAALAGYFAAVRSAVDLPLLAYHIPQRTGVDLPADLLVELAREGTIQGIKDSSGDLELQASLRREAGSGFAILNGRSVVTAAALRQGADGAILAVADGAPETVAEIVRAHRDGDDERADAVQASLEPLGEAFGARFGVPGIKAALDLRGWPGGGAPRPPLRPLDEAARGEVADALRRAGIRIP